MYVVNTSNTSVAWKIDRKERHVNVCTAIISHGDQTILAFPDEV